MGYQDKLQTMRVICAPDSFKESLSACDAAEAMRRGILSACPQAEVDCCPVADGGEGTTEALVHATHGAFHQGRVMGPLGEAVQARWGMLGDTENPGRDASARSTAVIEMAEAAGLHRVPVQQRDPTRTTTFGVGQMVRAACDAGAKRIILGLGGSSTTDGAAGMLQAMGLRLLDSHDGLITEPLSGGLLQRVARLDLDALKQRYADVTFTIACDVQNPLNGDSGAAAVYGPQKGATPKQVAELDAALSHWAQLIQDATGRCIAAIPGAGAAGGMGAGLIGLLGGTLEPGADLVLDAAGFDARVKGCDRCLTGEGRMDGQSAQGKLCMQVARRARAQGVPCVALVGSVGPGAEQCLAAGLSRIEEIGAGLPQEQSMRQVSELLEKQAAKTIRQCL